jgi:Tol biopolymer transport system component
MEVGMNRIARVLAILLVATACGGSDAVGPTTQPDHHEDMVIESIPYDAIGQSRIMFRRFSNNPPTSAGIVTLDGRTRAATKHFMHGVSAIGVSPDGTRVAYIDLTPFNNTQRAVDVNVADMDSPAGTALGGPGGTRRYPSWTADGSSVIYTETDDYANTPAVRIVSQPPSPGSTRQILWQRAGQCETAEAPSANAAGDIVFVFYPLRSDCLMEGSIARKKPGQPPEILYGPGNLILHSPAWSPSGAEIAFIQRSPGSTFANPLLDLTAMASDGSNLRTLATFAYHPESTTFSLCWGADGSTLFFSLGDSQTESHIYAVAASGGTAVPITTQAGAADFFVSCPR